VCADARSARRVGCNLKPVLSPLRTGAQVRVRPVEPADKPRLAAFLARLSPETVRGRFLTAKPGLSAAELRYLTEIDGRDHVALVAVPLDEPDRIVAVARSVRIADRPDTAEMAVVVDDEWQGHGLGSLLAEALADAARKAGIRRLAAIMLGANEPARRLVLRIAERLEDDAPAVVASDVHDGVRELTVELAR
jgi:GNAT superfamily N-acetyltransferase